MERNRLRVCTGMRYALMNLILEELREDKIKLTIANQET
jgi:hypothetical protein